MNKNNNSSSDTLNEVSKNFNFRGRGIKCPDTNWSSLAATAACNKEILQIYVSESPLQQMLALIHAITQIKINPTTRRVLFFYSEKSLQPNIKSMASYPIHFAKINKKDLFLGSSAYSIITEFTQAKVPFWLYIPDRAFWKDQNDYQKNFYYLAHAQKVFLFEEGSASYLYFGYNKNSPHYRPRLFQKSVSFLLYLLKIPDIRKNNIYSEDDFIKKQVPLLRHICKTIRKEYPLSLSQNSYQMYSERASRLFNSITANIEHNLHYSIAHFPNVTSYFQHPETLPLLSKLSYGTINFMSMFSGLTNTEKESFFSYFTIPNIPEFTKRYFPISHRKKILIIGTHFFSYRNPIKHKYNTNIYRWLSLIIEKYGNTHDIYYKPHPRFLTKILNGMKRFKIISKIHILPASYPTELLFLRDLWDLYFTSFTSSLCFGKISQKVTHIALLTSHSDMLSQIHKKLLIQMGCKKEKFKTLSELQEEWNNKG